MVRKTNDLLLKRTNMVAVLQIVVLLFEWETRSEQKHDLIHVHALGWTAKVEESIFQIGDIFAGLSEIERHDIVDVGILSLIEEPNTCT